MAERRMFAKKIIKCDSFMLMSHSAQNLYFHLCMHADDDGFVNSPLMILRLCLTDETDLDELIKNDYIIKFDSGVVLITHWKIHNYIRSDRYVPTIYQEEFAQVSLDSSQRYTSGIPMVDQRDTQVSIGKDSIDKDSVVTEGTAPSQQQFIVPTINDVKEYCREQNFSVDADKFIDYYNANGWKVGQNPIVDWKAVLRNWERKEKPAVKPSGFCNFTQPKTDFEKIKKMKRERMIAKLQQSNEKNS